MRSMRLAAPLGRAVAAATSLARPPVAAAAASAPQRGLSDKVLKQRMVAVGNIKKITKAMKMVASAKVRRAQDALNAAREFSKGTVDVVPAVSLDSVDAPAPAAAPAADGAAAKTGGFLLMAVTPDRGLCGSVNGSVIRATRARAQHYSRVGRPASLVGMGERTRTGLERLFGKQIAFTIGEHSKLRRRTFKQTALLTDSLLAVPFDQGEIVYNYFKNMISFETKHLGISSLAGVDSKAFEPFNIEGPADTLENFYAWASAVRLHTLLAETDMVEFSQRVNSMSNSSKNAEDMLAELRLLYNRVRQSRVTTELIEIISGAAAADDAAKAQ